MLFFSVKSEDIKPKRKRRDDDWEPNNQEMFMEDDIDGYEEKVKVPSKVGVAKRIKSGRKPKSSEDLLAAEKSKFAMAKFDDLSQLDSETMAKFYEFKFPKPLESYEEKPRQQIERKYKGEKEKKFTCHMCPRKFTLEYSLRQHCLITHSTHYLCSYCPVAFALDDMQGFKFHMFRHEHIGPLKCIQCGLSEYNRQKFIDHVQKSWYVHDNRCSICEDEMTTFDEYEQHIKERHNGQRMFKCEKCFDLFPEEKQLNSHRRKNHRKKRTNYPPKKPKRRYADTPVKVCDICGKAAKNMTEHMKYYHVKEEVLCKECGEVMENQYKYRAHVYRKHNKNPCPDCGKMYSKKDLKRHVQTQHTAIWDRKHKCDICGKGFISSRRLMEHVNTHTGDKPFECKICGTGFANNSNRRQHEKAHVGIRRKK